VLVRLQLPGTKTLVEVDVCSAPLSRIATYVALPTYPSNYDFLKKSERLSASSLDMSESSLNLHRLRVMSGAACSAVVLEKKKAMLEHSMFSPSPCPSWRAGVERQTHIGAMSQMHTQHVMEPRLRDFEMGIGYIICF
jgi:hypothetical protein